MRQTVVKARRAAEDLAMLLRLIELDGVRQRLNLDDFAPVPMLRAPSVVKAARWLPQVRPYIGAMCESSGLDTFFERAL